MSNYKKLFEGFQNFIKEEEINEVTEEELVDIEQVLNDLKPSDLPFGDIFGDKMRLIQPLPTQDENLDYLNKSFIICLKNIKWFVVIIFH